MLGGLGPCQRASCRLPVPWPVQLCCLPPGAWDKSCPPHACFLLVYDRPCRPEWPRGMDQGQSRLSQHVYGHRSWEPEAGGSRVLLKCVP